MNKMTSVKKISMKNDESSFFIEFMVMMTMTMIWVIQIGH